MTLAAGMMGRRPFLGLAALTFLGCGTSPETRPGAHPYNPGVGGGAGVGGGTGEGEVVYKFKKRVDLPAKFTADLRFAGSNILVLSAPGNEGITPSDNNYLVELNPAFKTKITLDIPDGAPVNKFTPLSSSYGVVTAMDGLYEHQMSLGGQPRPIPFPEGVSHATGSLRVGNKLFVATANLIGPSAYADGTLQVYDLADDGSILDNTRRSYPTSGKNPTGLALLSDGSLLVLSSGDRTENAEAFLDWFDPLEEDEEKIKKDTLFLGQMTAQLMGEIAIENNIAVIGSSDNSGRVLSVEVIAREILSQAVLDDEKEQYHSSIKIRGGRAFVTDFNTGKVYILEALTLAWLQTLDFREDLNIPKVNDQGKPVAAEAGPSVFIDDYFVQTFARGAAIYAQVAV